MSLSGQKDMHGFPQVFQVGLLGLSQSCCSMAFGFRHQRPIWKVKRMVMKLIFERQSAVLDSDLGSNPALPHENRMIYW